MVQRSTLRVEFTSWEGDSTRKKNFDNRIFQKKLHFLKMHKKWFSRVDEVMKKLTLRPVQMTVQKFVRTFSIDRVRAIKPLDLTTVFQF